MTKFSLNNSNLIKIAYLLGSLGRGGTETLMLDVFKYCRKEGSDIIGIYRKSGKYFDEFNKTGIPLLQVKPRFIFDPLYFRRLRKALKKNHVDVVHTQQAIDALYAKIACIGLGIKVILTFHGYNYRYGRMNNIITHFIINKTNLNIYVSNSQRTDYFKNYRVKNNAKQVVIYNGISFKKLNNVEFVSLRKEFNIPQSSLLLGSVGNFVKVRDQLTTCRFLNLLNKKEIDFAFLFAGARIESEAELFDQCTKYCEDHGLSQKVFFPGSRNDIPNILSQLDAFVYSTSHDTFGIAVIEAMAMGVPVFVNDWEVMIEITDGGNHGIIYETKNEENLMHRFMPFINQKEVYKEKARKDAIWARSHYGIQKHVSSLIMAYRSLYEI